MRNKWKILALAAVFAPLTICVSLGVHKAGAETCGTVPCSATVEPTPTPEVTLTPVPWCPIDHLCTEPPICTPEGCVSGTSVTPKLWLPFASN